MPKVTATIEVESDTINDLPKMLMAAVPLLMRQVVSYEAHPSLWEQKDDTMPGVKASVIVQRRKGNTGPRKKKAAS